VKVLFELSELVSRQSQFSQIRNTFHVNETASERLNDESPRLKHPECILVVALSAGECVKNGKVPVAASSGIEEKVDSSSDGTWRCGTLRTDAQCQIFGMDGELDQPGSEVLIEEQLFSGAVRDSHTAVGWFRSEACVKLSESDGRLVGDRFRPLRCSLGAPLFNPCVE
jgi:hypothetical protein